MHDFDLDQVAQILKTAKAFAMVAQQLLLAVTYLAEAFRERHRRRTHRRSAKPVVRARRHRSAKRRRR